MEKTKQGQIQITFHWIYIVIAGAIILLFFVGLVVKQKAVSEEQLSFEVVQIMESIFTAAEVSESTKNSIDISGLADTEFFFNCEDGVSNFGIQEQGTRVQNSINPMFSMKTIQAPRLVLWSLPYKLPYKVIDFLFVIPSNAKYVLIGEDDFSDEFERAASTKKETDENGETPELTPREELLKIDVEYKEILQIDPGASSHVRLIVVNDNQPPDIPSSSKLSTLPDDKVSAVVFSGNTVQYYRKSANSFVQDGSPVPLIMVPGERQAAKYAAIFAGDDDIYKCGMQKAFTRLTYLSEIYTSKTADIIDFYDGQTDNICYSTFTSIGTNNIQQEFNVYLSAVNTCNVAITLSEFDSCTSLIVSAVNLMTLNKDMRDTNCIALY
ncbi:hypothetical protein HOL21_04425 [Candidatus Woesearchaeota archaeon]|jgi:hypothetical protein|nr:hypothetical protein [Candidatus Woesearchaeota archaeon]MBT5397433.1 hypothetical protein [Candidatus Woesearchaeota archaeon]MBT5924955.1 hypothetical protein [Candidatus Woesearchaeota archaeon]MBT6367067.1 hypothetical protein [Candidatus Woesearchaeota archaeon]MBT7762833.1 hypothetical protein [Candidatus Woesearchaeota archaeon]